MKRVALGAIAIGLVLRFAHLDRKVYWHDEVFTSLRVAGYVGSRVQAEVSDQSRFTAADLLRYQQLPSAPSLADTWATLSDHPEHPPLYYLLAHGWARRFGASVAGYRAIAAGFGAIAMLAVFWLGRQLFPLSPTTAWIATALLAVSPVQLIYSQEAREYSLWVVGLLLAHGALVRSLQRDTAWAWVLYGLALELAWYGSLMTALLGLSHLVFMALSQRQLKTWLAFACAHGLAMGLFAPWLGVMAHGWGRVQTVTAWANEAMPLAFLAQFWGLHYSSTLVDFNAPLSHPFTVVGPALAIALLVVSLRHLIHKHPRQVALFIGCGLLVPPLVLMGGDVIRGSQFSGATRYFFPSLVLVPLAIAPLIDDNLAHSQRPQRLIGATLLALLLALGLTSGVAYSRAPAWWNKSFSSSNYILAAHFNQLPAPVILLEPGNNTLGEAISLSHYLTPNTEFWLLPENQLPPAATLKAVVQTQPQTALFVVNPTEELLDTLPAGWQVEVDQTVPAYLVRLQPARSLSPPQTRYLLRG